ncbi:hypothetical protein DYB30_008503 [Aphanomyces astaci]|uniref:Retrotransposon gag domain-containing protein n=2 Tax=Aphanomyces astaci TaxID=112090 RepID=A0A397CUM1_APHAT|nr:hypothetical protein DYB30_008503 [Aphanomyces astaci]
MSSSSTPITPAHQLVLDRMYLVFGEQDTATLLGGLSPENQARLVEGIGRLIDQAVTDAVTPLTALHAALESQLSTMAAHGRTFEESLARSATEVERLTYALHTSEQQSPSRLKPIKLEVTKFGGAESDKLLRWILQVETAANAQRILDDDTRVAFAMSHLKGRAEDWAFSKRLMDPLCFPSLDDFMHEMKSTFLPPNSDFRYRTKFLECKQEKRSLQEYIHDLRFLAANVNDEESLPEAMRVTVFMAGLNQGPARTQLFREYPTTFEAAVRIALSESFSSTLAHGRTNSSDMEVSTVAHGTEDRKCFNCGRVGHLRVALCCHRP